MLFYNYRMSGNCENTTCSCFQANIFGGWHPDPDMKEWFQYLHWDTFRGEKHILKRLVMKIRPVDFQPISELNIIILRLN